MGVILDPLLLLEAQMAWSAFHQLWLVAQLHPYLDRDRLSTVVYGNFKVRYRYALYVGLPLETVWKLQLVQNSVARLLTGARRFEHITPILV